MNLSKNWTTNYLTCLKRKKHLAELSSKNSLSLKIMLRIPLCGSSTCTGYSMLYDPHSRASSTSGNLRSSRLLNLNMDYTALWGQSLCLQESLRIKCVSSIMSFVTWRMLRPLLSRSLRALNCGRPTG